MNSGIKIKLPLIGINEITNSKKEKKKFISEKFFSYASADSKIYDKEGGKKVEKTDDERIREIETALGNYIKFTEKYKKILNFLFPGRVDENFEDKAHLFSCPLAIKEEDNNENTTPDGYSSAWANLMYELGEFGIDEIKDPDLLKKIPHIYKKGDTWYTWWANIEEAEEIVIEIWQKITCDDALIVFVDDDPDFSRHFLGTKSVDKYFLNVCVNNSLLWYIETGSDFENIDRGLIWFNTGSCCDEDGIKTQIKRIIKDNGDKKLLVFVIDLLFKKKVNNALVNCIKGDEIIDFIRTEKANSLIIGFTGGTSPFIINSAEKSGADIVVFKKRGDDPYSRGDDQYSSVGHGPGGNPVGVFDLLWAISWNVSVWRLLEYHKNRYLNNKTASIENIPMKIFKKIDNVSPFWKVYLEHWKTQINEEKIKRLLGK